MKIVYFPMSVLGVSIKICIKKNEICMYRQRSEYKL